MSNFAIDFGGRTPVPLDRRKKLTINQYKFQCTYEKQNYTSLCGADDDLRGLR